MHIGHHHSFNFNEHKFRWAGIPILTLFIVLIVNDNRNCLLPNFWLDILITATFTICIWNVNHFTVRFFRRKLPSLNQTKHRIVRTFVATSIHTILICILLDFVFFHILSHPEPYTINTENFITGLLANTFVLSVYEGLYFFEKWRETMVSAEELKKANLQIQFDSLKNQVNPHFLFNSLNTLSSLIEEDKDSSIKFVQKMSSVYRYLLQSNDKELTTVEKELEFISAYVFMLKTRFEESLQIEIDITEKFKACLIPPLTLQMLVENAVKHNVVSEENPLLVKIHTDAENNLVVGNTLQRKTHLVKSNGLGLKNIMQRYELLGGRNVEVVEDEKSFVVKVPLIDPGKIS